MLSPPPQPCNCPISVTSWENSRVHESCHAEVCQYKQENESIVHWDGWGDGFCQPGAPVEKTSSAVTLRFFPPTTITQRSTLPPQPCSKAEFAMLQKFPRSSFGDRCSSLCKALCSRAQKAPIVHRAHRALPLYCLICNLAFYYFV